MLLKICVNSCLNCCLKSCLKMFKQLFKKLFKQVVLKKLFKHVASHTHPDKIEHKSEFEKEEKEKIFRESLSALETNDIITMLEMALKLNIEPPELSNEHLKAIDKKIRAMQGEIKTITTTYLWHWHTTEEKEQKEKILNELLEKSDPRS